MALECDRYASKAARFCGSSQQLVIVKVALGNTETLTHVSLRLSTSLHHCVHALVLVSEAEGEVSEAPSASPYPYTPCLPTSSCVLLCDRHTHIPACQSLTLVA